MALRNDGATAEHIWCVFVLALDRVKLSPIVFADKVRRQRSHCSLFIVITNTVLFLF
jgi:hypothetical protein